MNLSLPLSVLLCSPLGSAFDAIPVSAVNRASSDLVLVESSPVPLIKPCLNKAPLMRQIVTNSVKAVFVCSSASHQIDMLDN